MYSHEAEGLYYSQDERIAIKEGVMTLEEQR